jgi:site-specific recombinase XerD
MGTFVEHMEGEGLSRASIGLYQRYLLEFMVYMDQDGSEVDQADGKHVAGYLQRLQRRGLTNGTRRIHLLVLRKFFAWRVSVGARSDNPAEHLKMRGVRRNKVHTVLSVQELEALHASYRTEEGDSTKAATGKGYGTKAKWAGITKLVRERNKVMIGLLVYQGMTTTEIAALALPDLRLKEGLIDVQAGKFSKGRTLELKATQILEMADYVQRVRAALLKFHREGEQALFLNAPRAGQREAKGNSLQVWKRLSEELREQCQRFQDVQQVRASVITNWLGKHDLRQVQYMAGHRFISSTERYQVGQIADLQNDIDKFHPNG